MWDAQRAAIQRAAWLSDYVGSSLGPNSSAKILIKGSDDFTITNDGVLMLDAKFISSPTEEIIVEMAKSLRNKYGDGSKSAVILACELLKRAEALLESGVHPNSIIKGFNESADEAIRILDSLGQPLQVFDTESLHKVVEVILRPRFSDKEDLMTLSSAIVQAVRNVSAIDPHSNISFDVQDVSVKCIEGGALSDTEVVLGVVIDKEVEPGAPKIIEEARIALLRSALGIERSEWDTRIKLTDPSQVGTLLRDESKIILDQVGRITSSGANVVLCERDIDALARQHFNERSILVAKWIARGDMRRLAQATNATIVADIFDLSFNDLGAAGCVAEKHFGEKKMLVVRGCRNPKAVTILVAGPNESVVKEAERSIVQALRSLKDLLLRPRVVLGCGAVEAELASRLREYARGQGGKARSVAMAFADSLDSIPVALIRNSGGNILELLTSLRTRHQKGEYGLGVDADSGNLINISDSGIIEPLGQKTRLIRSACEAATTVLSLDDVVAAEYREEKQKNKEEEKEKALDNPTSQEVLRSNILVVKTIADLIRNSLGPNGMMKLVVDNVGDARATRDGVTILKFLYAQHPVARLLVGAAESHSKRFGDGTKTLIVLIGELVSKAEELLGQGVQLPAILRGYKKSSSLVINELERFTQGLDLNDREMLAKTLASVVQESVPRADAGFDRDAHIGKITDIILDAFSQIHEAYLDLAADEFDIRKIKIVKKAGSGSFESRLVDGYVVEKEVASNTMPKYVKKARIAVLDYWLGITGRSLKRDTEIQIHETGSLRDYLDSGSKLSREIANKIVSSGANVVFCSKRTDDLSSRFLANAGIMVVEAVLSDDMEALSSLTGAVIVSDPSRLDTNHLGEANLVEEREILGARFTFVEGCPNRGYACLLIRGGTASVTSEVERTILKTIRTLIPLSRDPRVVPGGGLSELDIARELKRQARKTIGREQLAMLGFAAALEAIPRILYENAGSESSEDPSMWIDVLEKEAKTPHAKNPRVWDPYPQKKQVILGAASIVDVILKLGHAVRCRERPRKNEALIGAQEKEDV